MSKVQNDNIKQQIYVQQIQQLKLKQKNSMISQHQQIKQKQLYQKVQLNEDEQMKQHIKQQDQQDQDQEENEQNQLQNDNNEDDFKNNQQNIQQQNSRNQNILKNLLLNNQKISSCNCKKSKCLKMYCECFAKGISCKDTCKCFNCQNTKNLIRQKKNQGKPDQDIQRSEDSNKKSIKLKQKSCNCKKSSCLKKYCQCYNANQACSEFCKCQDCKNNGDQNNFRPQKSSFNGAIVQSPSNNNTFNKNISQAVSEQNYERKQEQIIVKKRQKIDQEQIQTKISQILKLIPEQKYQNMLDFLALILS